MNDYRTVGASVTETGVSFCVWAPFASAVLVMGDFNDWSETGTPLTKDEAGYWSGEVTGARVGQEYKYVVWNGEQKLLRNDPRALQLTASGGNSVIVSGDFDWTGDDFQIGPINEQVIYELHVGTFYRADPATPGTFAQAAEKLDYLAGLGITAIELMPCTSAWEDRWWGYMPNNMYAIEASYGGRHAFQAFVKAAHARGIAVLLDVVYNHMDGELWCFDGWCENGKGGVYFYNDWRAETPWGDTRLDYGRSEVRDYIADNAVMWLRDCHVDGLRLDSVLAMRKAAHHLSDGSGEDIPETWGLLQRINTETHQAKAGALLIAEDLQGNEWITKPSGEGGAGFNTQWDASFAACLREVLEPPLDESRDLEKIRFSLNNRFNNNPLQRIIYSESHDNDANGHARLNEEIAPGAADGLFARKRSALAALLLMTAPGVPMLFQGQELLEDGEFTHWRPLDWSRAESFPGVLQLYKDLISLRRNEREVSAGLLGQSLAILQLDNTAKVVAYHRWQQGGPGDDVVVAINISNQIRQAYQIPFPRPGVWKTRFNSDWQGYSPDYTNIPTPDTMVKQDTGVVNLAPYSAVILSQTA